MQRATLDKTIGCLCGVLLGDAMGAPVEVLTREAILLETNGNGVKTFQDLYSFSRRLDTNLPFSIGDTTDDWAFTTVLARSIIEDRGYDHMACARRFVELYRKGVIGMGRTTRQSLKRLKDLFDSNNFDDLTLEQISTGSVNGGEGAGVAMRISPMVLYGCIKFDRFIDVREDVYKPIILHGSITHQKHMSSVAACILGRVLYDIMLDVGGDVSCMFQFKPVDYIKILLKDAAYLEKSYFIFPEIRMTLALGCVLNHLDNLDLLRQRFCRGKEAFCAINTVAFAIAVFLRNLNNFEAGVLEAVNSGGDTDTTASMVGALLGAYNGVGAIPKGWLEFQREKISNACILASELYSVASEV